MNNIKIPKIQNKLEIFNKANDSTDMYLYGTIREPYPWENECECISVKDIKKTLSTVDTSNLNIHLNSPGGDVFSSISICNLLKQHSAKINIYIDGLAASGASIIAMAGDKIIMPKNSMMMIHQASTFGYGNATEMRKIADDLDKINSAVKASYENKFIGTDEELINLINAETWLTAEECKTLGFCDEIMDEQQDPEEPTQEDIKNSILNKYMNKVKEPQPQAPTPTEPTKVVENKNKIAIQNLFKKLGGME